MRHNAGKIAVAAAAIMALATVEAPAQAQLDKFIISGDAAKRLGERSELTMDTARKLADACIAFAQKNNVAVSIAIIDQFGEPIFFTRMDGQGKLNIDTAFLKAKTTVITRQPSHADMNNLFRGNTTEFHQGYFNGIFPNKGALPIKVGDHFLGAMGVGGSNVDEECAHAALEQVIGPQPPLLPNIPRPGVVNGGG